jgi:hypothetical protein
MKLRKAYWCGLMSGFGFATFLAGLLIMYSIRFLEDFVLLSIVGMALIVAANELSSRQKANEEIGDQLIKINTERMELHKEYWYGVMAGFGFAAFLAGQLLLRYPTRLPDPIHLIIAGITLTVAGAGFLRSQLANGREPGSSRENQA